MARLSSIFPQSTTTDTGDRTKAARKKRTDGRTARPKSTAQSSKPARDPITVKRQRESMQRDQQVAKIEAMLEVGNWPKSSSNLWLHPLPF